MKAKLEFTLPEERNEFALACNGGKYFSALFQFKEALRKLIKYDEDLDNKTLNNVAIQFDLCTEDIDFDEIE